MKIMIFDALLEVHICLALMQSLVLHEREIVYSWLGGMIKFGHFTEFFLLICMLPDMLRAF